MKALNKVSREEMEKMAEKCYLESNPHGKYEDLSEEEKWEWRTEASMCFSWLCE